MKRHLMLGTVFSAALAVGVFAQSEAQSPTGQDTKSSSNQTVTVTGCLKADTSSPSAAPGAPGAPGAPASSASAGFILEESAGGAAAANPGEKPSPTATSGMSSNTTYKLSGSSSDLATLVGKKVEVKGTLQSRAGGATGGGSSDTAKTKQLRVTSVKEVSGSCSQ